MIIVFFGSFQHYSTLILAALAKTKDITIAGVVTTSPKPDKTPVHQLAEKLGLPVFTPDILDPVVCPLPTADYFVTAGYGKLLPPAWLSYPAKGSLNLHFSLLPKYRGANPAEWAILLGETETGITLIQMAEKFDTGAILAQASLPIEPADTRLTLYQKLYTLGAEKLPQWLLSLPLNPKPQIPDPGPYAHRFTRDQAFIDWRLIVGPAFDPNLLPPYLQGAYGLHPQNFLANATRALAGFPGLWTIIPTQKGPKRMKIMSLSGNKPGLVQIEGYAPATFNQIKNQIINFS